MPNKPLKLPKVYALMVTQRGRADFNRLALESFKGQTYPNKTLIVVGQDGYEPEWVSEDHGVQIIWVPAPKNYSLGELRNLGFEFIPDGFIMACWDDDDWSHPDRLDIQVRHIQANRLNSAFMRHVLLYDFVTDTARIKTTQDGIPGTVVAHNQPSIRYASRNKSEDVSFKRKLHRAGRAAVMPIDPILYLRFSHGSNTWGWDHFKMHLLGAGYRPTLPKDQLQYLDEIVQKYRNQVKLLSA